MQKAAVAIVLSALVGLWMSPHTAAQTAAARRTAAPQYPRDDAYTMAELTRGRAVVALRRPATEWKEDDIWAAFSQLQDKGRSAEIPGLLAQLSRTSLAKEAAGWQALRNNAFAQYESRLLMDALRPLADKFKARLSELPREDEARAAWTMAQLELALSGTRGSQPYRDAQRDLIAAYPDTTLAEELRISQIGTDNYATRPAMLETYAAEHRGSCAAFRALSQAGDLLSLNAAPREDDAVPRLRRVLAIEAQLEAAPASCGLAPAARMVTGFYMSDRSVTPTNATQLIALLEPFIRAHFALDERNPSDNGIGYAIIRTLGTAFEKAGDPASLETFLDQLAADGHARDVAWLRANMVNPRGVGAGERAGVALERFGVVARDASNAHAPMALAEIGNILFYVGRSAEAAAVYREFLQKYPNADWAWMAQMRLGWTLEVLDDVPGAIDTYHAAAVRPALDPPMRVLALHLAAQAELRAGRPDDALRDDRQALSSWDYAYGASYRLSLPGKADPLFSPPRIDLSRTGLAAEIDELQVFLLNDATRALLPARQAVRRQDWATAVDLFVGVSPPARPWPFVTEMRHRAAAELAVDRAPTAGRAAARAELAPVAAQPMDFGVLLARMAGAAIDWLDDKPADARAAMNDGLTAWARYRGATAPDSDLERDVAAIRAAVFLPTGGGIYGTGQWNAFSWPFTPPPFAIVRSDVLVHMASGLDETVDVRPVLPGGATVIWLRSPEIAAITSLFGRLGGTAAREPRAVMETPNQPIGDSTKILALFNSFFPSRAGHWGGWEIETYPSIRDIRFIDTARTHALARVVIGYSGATVVLRKIDGRWQAVELVDQWVT